MQGERAGGRVDQIAAAHRLRIVLVVLTLPALYRLLGLQGSDPYEMLARIVHRDGLAMPIAATVAMALAWRALSWPNAWLLGPLAVTLALTAIGHDWSALPPWLVIAGQVAIGASACFAVLPAQGAGVPVVTAFHVARSVATMTALGAVYRLLGRLRGWER